MDLSKILLYSAIAIAGTIVTATCVRLIWLAVGAYKINRAGPRRLLASHHAIWRDPGDVAALDIVNRARRIRRCTRWAVSLHRRAFERIAALRVCEGRSWAALARQVGERGSLGKRRRPPGVGVRLFRRNHLLHRRRHNHGRARARAHEHVHRRRRPVSWPGSRMCQAAFASRTHVGCIDISAASPIGSCVMG